MAVLKLRHNVLILVVLDYVGIQNREICKVFKLHSLNPCCAGLCRDSKQIVNTKVLLLVLILVVLDYVGNAAQK